MEIDLKKYNKLNNNDNDNGYNSSQNKLVSQDLQHYELSLDSSIWNDTECVIIIFKNTTELLKAE